ncbi:MAG: ribose transport system permease protein, partial [Sulfitobacter sp.]
VGNNPEAAYVAGLARRRLIVSAYVISALCAGLTGILLASYANGATLRMGDDYLLPSIAAVVVGGSSILGGRGTFLGTIGGAMLLTTLATILSALGIGQGWKTVMEGGVILLALILLRDQVFDGLRAMLVRKD